MKVILIWLFGFLVGLMVGVSNDSESDSSKDSKPAKSITASKTKTDARSSLPKTQKVPQKPIPTPPKPKKPKPKPVTPAQYDYKVVKERNSSFGNIRNRIILEIEAPTVQTDRARLEAMMIAAVDRHRKDWPHVVNVRLWNSYEKDSAIRNGITYAPDGCGWTGDPCLGNIWTKLHKGDFPDKLASWGKPTDKEKEESKEKRCRQDIQCWGDKHSLAATFACQPLIEARAKYDYKWTDGWFGAKLQRFRWKDRKVGSVSYTGDQIKFQNGFGAWQKVTYWCDYNPKTKKASARVIQSG